MEAATLPPQQDTPNPEPPTPVEAHRPDDHPAFRWQTDVRVDALDFHAVLRVPNPFQEREIREKALAAKARRVRQLRDPQSDSHVILEAELEEIERGADPQTLVDEIVARGWWKREVQAMKDVGEREEFEHIDRDRDRFRELEAIDADKRPQEEYDELRRHIEKWGEALDVRLRELEEPQRASLSDRDLPDLIDLVRDDRINAEGSAAFTSEFTKRSIFAGCLKPVDAGQPHERYYASVEQLEDEHPMIVEALHRAHGDLMVGLRRGNS
jgi:hypothetical protein